MYPNAMYLLLVSLRVIAVICQKMSDEVILDLVTPMRELGEGCGYEGCPFAREGMLNVHIVPHTHGELGFTKTFDQHYTGVDDYFDNVNVYWQRILDSTITELWNKEHRKFTLSDTPYLFHWWANRDGTVRRMVYQLIRQGRLHIVGGGWGMPDEACPSYHALIDHFTHTLRKLNKTFGQCGRPLVAWQADVFGHSREFANLATMLAFDGLFINPISYEDELNRMNRKELEMLWRGSDDLGPESDIFTHKLFDGYWSPPGFCFGSLCNGSLIITSDSQFTNVEERVKDFIFSVKHRQGFHYGTNHIMVVMGKRMGYYDAPMWFNNIDTLINKVNAKSYQSGDKVHLMYSAPACYLKAVYDSAPALPIKQDDFMPITFDKKTHFTGLYTSRPTIKYMAREGHVFLQMAKQMHVLAGLPAKESKLYDELTWVMGAFQDHSIITGGMMTYVKNYYTLKMYHAVQKSTLLIKKAFNKLSNSPATTTYFRCAFNVSSCRNTNALRSFIVIYNPLAWPVTMPVRIPVVRHLRHVVFNPRLQTVRAVSMKMSSAVLSIPHRDTNADHEIIFMADNLPPMGYRSYYIESTTVAEQKKNNKRRSIFKKLRKSKKKKYLSRQTDQIKIDDESMLDTEDDDLNDYLSTTSYPDDYLATTTFPDDYLMTTMPPDFTNETTSSPVFAQTTTSETSETADSSETSERASYSPSDVANETKERGINKALFGKRQPYNTEGEEDTWVTMEPRRTKEDNFRRYYEPPKRTTKEHSSKFKTSTKRTTEISHKTAFVSPIITDKEASITDKLQTQEDYSTRYYEEFPEQTTDIDKYEKYTKLTTEIGHKTAFVSPIITGKEASITDEPKQTPEDYSRRHYDEFPERTTEENQNEQSTKRTTEMGHDTAFASQINTDKEGRIYDKHLTREDSKNRFSKRRYLKKRIKTYRNKDVRYMPHPTPVYRSKFNRPYEEYSNSPANKHQQIIGIPDDFYHKSIEQNEIKSNPFNNVAILNKHTEKDIEMTEPNTKETPPDLGKAPLPISVKTADELHPTLTTARAYMKMNTQKETRKNMREREDVKLYMDDSDWPTKPPKFTSVGDDDDDDDYGSSLFDASPKRPTLKTSIESTSEIVQFIPENIETLSQGEDEEDYRRLFEKHRRVMVTRTTAKPTVTTTEFEPMEDPDFDEDKHYFYKVSNDKFIKNKYVKIHLDAKNQVSHVALSNGVEVALTIDLCYYASDDPVKLNRPDEKRPGPYVFKPMDPKPVIIKDYVKSLVHKTYLVEEVQYSVSNWAGFVVRLYVERPVIEVDWVVGPVPIDDNIGKDVFIRYTTDLVSEGVFFTDSNGRQTMKRVRNSRPTFQPLLNNIPSNIYPVTSKIHIEDRRKNIRFVVFNDRAQGGTSLNDGQLDLMLHRRILTDDEGINAFLNDTEYGQGIVVRGKHVIYISKADYMPNKIFEKKLAKEIELAPLVFAGPYNAYGDRTKEIWYGHNNEFKGISKKLPAGIHVLTLQEWDGKLLLRLENYLEKADTIRCRVKTVFIKDLFTGINIISVRETTLGGNVWLDERMAFQWNARDKFVKDFNAFYNGNGYVEFSNDDLRSRELVNITKGITLSPQQIRTFIVTYEYNR